VDGGVGFGDEREAVGEGAVMEFHFMVMGCCSGIG
jgi:hypothetical protein